MLKASLESLSKYILWFAEHYHKAKSQIEEDAKHALVDVKYKISNTFEEYCRKGKLLIQSRQGGAYSYMTPAEICADQHILGHMHPLDVNTVTKLHAHEMLRAVDPAKHFRLMRQRYSDDGRLHIYTLYDPIDEYTFDLTEEELLDSPYFLENLKSGDGVSIGFNLGMNHHQRTLERIKDQEKA